MELRDGLVPEAVEWLRTRAPSDITLMALPPTLSEGAHRPWADTRVEELARGPFWQDCDELRELRARYADELT